MRTEVITAKLLNPDDLLKDKLGVQLGQQVGDFGCGGAGYFSLPAARLVGANGKVYAIDILKTALAGVVSKAKLEGLMNIKTVWSDLERLGAAKITPESLDHILLINIMFQSRQNDIIIQEAKRLLRTGGKLLVVDWKVEATPLGPPLSNRLTAETIKQIVTKFGFAVENEFAAGPYHYGLIFVK